MVQLPLAAVASWASKDVKQCRLLTRGQLPLNHRGLGTVICDSCDIFLVRRLSCLANFMRSKILSKQSSEEVFGLRSLICATRWQLYQMMIPIYHTGESRPTVAKRVKSRVLCVSLSVTRMYIVR